MRAVSGRTRRSSAISSDAPKELRAWTSWPRPFAARADVAAPPYSTASAEVTRLPGGTRERDAVAVEEPLEIRIGGEPIAVTMRTPGHDEELALGFCLSGGLRPRSAELPKTWPRTRSTSPPRPSTRIASGELLHELLVRRLRQGRTRSGPGRGAAGRERPASRGGRRRRPPRPAARRAGGLRCDRRPARDRAVRSRRAPALCPRGRRSPQRDGQGAGLGLPRRQAAAAGTRSCASVGDSPSSSSRKPPSRAVRCS